MRRRQVRSVLGLNELDVLVEREAAAGGDDGGFEMARRAADRAALRIRLAFLREDLLMDACSADSISSSRSKNGASMRRELRPMVICRSP
jgi:hypothetical protein